MTPRKGFSVARVDPNGGNGKVYVSINLTLLHWVAGLLIMVMTIAGGMWGLLKVTAPLLIDPEIELWMTTNHLPLHREQMKVLEAKIDKVDAKVDASKNERALQVTALQDDVTEIKTDMDAVRAFLMGKAR